MYDDLVEIFLAHRFTMLGQCACGWALPTYGRRGHDPAEVARHLAAEVLDAGFRKSSDSETGVDHG